MFVGRRTFVIGAVAAIGASTSLAQPGAQERAHAMYGLIGKMKAAPGKREELVAILLEGIVNMPGCLSYIVAQDTAEDDAIWITEVWETKEQHDASLALPSVRAAITKAKPMIAGFEKGTTTVPIGGHGLVAGRQ